jgi:hypothetical protein
MVQLGTETYKENGKMGIKTKFNPMGGVAGVKMVNLTVVTTPSDATCTLTYNGQTYNTKTLSVEEGSTVAYSISATGYTTQSGSWVVNADTTQTITLNKQTYLLTVITSPANADCRLYYNGEYYYQKTLTVEYGATVSYYVYGVTGYGTKSDSWTITSTTTETVELSPILYELRVEFTPSDATCVLYYNGAEHIFSGYPASVPVQYNTVVNYRIYKTGYVTQEGSWTITGDTLKRITLAVQYTLTVSTNPNNATCTLTYGGSSYSSKSATVASGTVINYSVYHSIYGTTTGSITMNSNKTLTCTGASSTTSKYQLDSDLQIVGSPSITSDGLMTSITADDYVRTINSASSYMSETNYEIQLKFKVSSLGRRRFPFANSWVSNPVGANIEILASNKLRFTAGYSGATLALNWSTTNTITTNTWYTVNLKNNNNTYTVDAGNLGTHSTTTRKTTWGTSYGLNYGNLRGSTTLSATNTTIDLKNSWVKSNGSYVIYNVGTTTSYYWNTTVT